MTRRRAFDDPRTWENRQIARLLNVPSRQLIFWSARGLVEPARDAHSRGTRRKYDIFNLLQFAVLRELWHIGGNIELMKQAMEAINHAGIATAFFQESRFRETRGGAPRAPLPFLSGEYRRYLVVFPPGRGKRVGVLVRIPASDPLHAVYCEVGPERLETTDDLFVDEGHVSMTVKPKGYSQWTRDELLASPQAPTLTTMDLTVLRDEIRQVFG